MKKLALGFLMLFLVCPQAKAENITWGVAGIGVIVIAGIGVIAIGGAAIAIDYYFSPPTPLDEQLRDELNKLHEQFWDELEGDGFLVKSINVTRVEKIISEGANVNARRPRDDDEKTPLADTDATPLHFLASRISEKTNISTLLDTALLLVEKGADVNATNSAGQTPLHILAGNTDWHGPNPQLMEICLLNGDINADINARDNDGRTPLDCALGINKYRLRQAGAKTGAEMDAKNS